MEFCLSVIVLAAWFCVVFQFVYDIVLKFAPLLPIKPLGDQAERDVHRRYCNADIRIATYFSKSENIALVIDNSDRSSHQENKGAG